MNGALYYDIRQSTEIWDLPLSATSWIAFVACSPGLHIIYNVLWEQPMTGEKWGPFPSGKPSGWSAFVHCPLNVNLYFAEPRHWIAWEIDIMPLVSKHVKKKNVTCIAIRLSMSRILTFPSRNISSIRLPFFSAYTGSVVSNVLFRSYWPVPVLYRHKVGWVSGWLMVSGSQFMTRVY